MSLFVLLNAGEIYALQWVLHDRVHVYSGHYAARDGRWPHTTYRASHSDPCHLGRLHGPADQYPDAAGSRDTVTGVLHGVGCKLPESLAHAHLGHIRGLWTKHLSIFLTLQDVDRNGVIDETDLMSQSDRVCIAENTAIEQFYNSEISKYADGILARSPMRSP
jgi:hypothetical protein